jgi:RNA polymerase sigma factor (TIGR02999 family)
MPLGHLRDQRKSNSRVYLVSLLRLIQMCGRGGNLQPVSSRVLDNFSILHSIRPMSEATRILEAVQQGDPKAASELLPLVYDELRKLASHKMAHEAPGHTLQATALVHEAWLRLIKPTEQSRFANRGHFFGAAAEAMRRILVESARRKKRLKHGGQLERVDVDAVELPMPMPDDELLALDEALNRLPTVDSRAAEVVKLCFFVGLTQEQAAKELGLSLSTAERLWSFARAWLFREMQKTRDTVS